MSQCVKVAYDTKTEAIQDRTYIYNQRRHFRKWHSQAAKNGRKLTPYECKICGKWHLTSQAKRKY